MFAKTSQGFRRADTQGKFVPDRRCANAENFSSGLSLALRGRQERAFAETKVSVGCGQMDKVSKIGWFTRREGLVGLGEYFELNSEGNE